MPNGVTSRGPGGCSAALLVLLPVGPLAGRGAVQRALAARAPQASLRKGEGLGVDPNSHRGSLVGEMGRSVQSGGHTDTMHHLDDECYKTTNQRFKNDNALIFTKKNAFCVSGASLQRDVLIRRSMTNPGGGVPWLPGCLGCLPGCGP